MNLSVEKYQKISIACSNDMMEAFSNYLLERNTGGLVIEDGKQNGQQILTAYLSSLKNKPFIAEEIEKFFNINKSHFPGASYRLLALEYIQAEDWLAGWKRTCIPIHVTDKIVVRPTWESYQIQPGEIEIVIDPKMAFGTGHHETTSGCLAAMEKLGVCDKRALDYGCGAGILAIAAAKMGASEVIACDIDPEAIACARENFALNDAAVELVESGNFIADPPCDIIAANLSIDQIIALYDELDKSLTADGYIIYSGIPFDDRQRFLDFIEKKPYKIVDEISGDEWISYIGQRK